MFLLTSYLTEYSQRYYTQEDGWPVATEVAKKLELSFNLGFKSDKGEL